MSGGEIVAESTTTKNLMGVKVRPSRSHNEHDPGHLAVFWSTGPEKAQKRFRGFGFRISDLPPHARDAAQWRDYLFQNCVRGVVKDDLGMLDDYLHRQEILACGTWRLDDDQYRTLENLAAVGVIGWYSFNPDSVPSPDPAAGPCHNCVTWGTQVVNTALGEDALPRVREGRLKEILKVLAARKSDTQEDA